MDTEHFESWNSLPPDHLDLHNMTLTDAKELIAGHLDYAKRSNFKSVTFIHGHRHGTAIRSYLWQSIANNQWPRFVPGCSDPYLEDTLDSFDKRHYRKGDFQTAIPATGQFDNFVFCSGKTTLPLAR
jgi:hypothetical protein